MTQVAVLLFMQDIRNKYAVGVQAQSHMCYVASVLQPFTASSCITGSRSWNASWMYEALFEACGYEKRANFKLKPQQFFKATITCIIHKSVTRGKLDSY